MVSFGTCQNIYCLQHGGGDCICPRENAPAAFTPSRPVEFDEIDDQREAHTDFKKQLRNNRASNRANRGQADHDIMEGLPVRQWRKQTATVSKIPTKEVTTVESDPNDIWKELPMPRGSELYPPHSQALLRAARMGQFSKPPPRPAEDEKEAGDEEDAEGEPDYGYVATRWAPVAREQEQPEPEFLAKRRKGLPSLHEEVPGPAGAVVSMRKVKVRKVDVEGNATVFDVLAPEGVAVEGEIVEGEAVTTTAPAPGTVIEGVGVANAEGVIVAGEQVMPTPQRRRPPPPKRKNKGPGRGRKKRPMVAAGVDGAAAATAVPSSRPEGQPATGDLLQVPASGSRPTSAAGEDSAMQDGEEGSEDDDEDGEDGEDGELSDGEGARTPSRSPSKPANASLPPQPLPETAALFKEDITMEEPPKEEPVPEPSTRPSDVAPQAEDHEMTDAPSATATAQETTSHSVPAPPALPAVQESTPVVPTTEQSTSTPLPQAAAAAHSTTKEEAHPDSKLDPVLDGKAETNPDTEPSAKLDTQSAAPPAAQVEAPTAVQADTQPSEQADTQTSTINTAPPALSSTPTPPQPEAPVPAAIEPVADPAPVPAAAVDPPEPAPPADATFVEKAAEEKISDAVVEANLPTTHNALDGLTEPKGPDHNPADEVLPAKPAAASDIVNEPPVSVPVPEAKPEPAAVPALPVTLEPEAASIPAAEVEPVPDATVPTTSEPAAEPLPAPVVDAKDVSLQASESSQDAVPAAATSLEAPQLDTTETKPSQAEQKAEEPAAKGEEEQKAPASEENLLGTLEAHLENNP